MWIPLAITLFVDDSRVNRTNVFVLFICTHYNPSRHWIVKFYFPFWIHINLDTVDTHYNQKYGFVKRYIDNITISLEARETCERLISIFPKRICFVWFPFTNEFIPVFVWIKYAELNDRTNVEFLFCFDFFMASRLNRFYWNINCFTSKKCLIGTPTPSYCSLLCSNT